MDIGLCMTVKDEANRIEECLDGIHDLFAEIVVIDTGSSDRTTEILYDKYGIRAQPGALNEARCNTLADVRNNGYEQLKTPWVMCLDADERIPRTDLARVAAWPNDRGPAGYFCPWITMFPDGHVVEDYKLSLFRHGFSKRGLVHDNVQPSLREKGARAEWTDALEILHHQEEAKLPGKNDYYAWRLDKAISIEPDWIRYYWFRGLLRERMGKQDKSRADFETAFAARSTMFPVECLNAGMYLAAWFAREGQLERGRQVVHDALAYHAQVSGDFEVDINFRIRPWLERALEALESGNAEKVVPYDFAHGSKLRAE